MSTPVICPGCQEGFAAAAELRGKKVKCPSCGAAISIPGAPAAPAADPQQMPQMPTPQQWPAPQQGFDSTQPSWLGMGQPTQSFQQSWPGQTATYQPPRAEAPASITTAATMLFIAAGLGVVQHVLGIILAAGMAMGSIEMEGPEDVARGGVWVVVGVIGLPCDLRGNSDVVAQRPLNGPESSDLGDCPDTGMWNLCRRTGRFLDFAFAE